MPEIEDDKFRSRHDARDWRRFFLGLVSKPEIKCQKFSVSSRCARLNWRNSHSRLENEKMTLANLWFGRFLHNNHEDLILQDYPGIKGSVQVECFQSGSPTYPFSPSLMIIHSSKRQFWGIWLYRNLMAGIFSELSTSLNKSSAAKSTNNRPLQNLSALDHPSDLISHHDRQKLPISALIQSEKVKGYPMAHIISM